MVLRRKHNRGNGADDGVGPVEITTFANGMIVEGSPTAVSEFVDQMLDATREAGGRSRHFVAGGAQVAAVTDGSPAARAGLQAGDVITAFDGDTVASADALTAAVTAKSPGDEVTVTYTRDGDSHTAQVTLGTRPS